MSSVTAEALRPFHWRITGLAGLAFAGNGIDAGVVSFALPGLRSEWDLSPAQLGFMLAAFGLGQLGGAVLGGMVADRVGRRLAFWATATLAGSSLGLGALAPQPALFALLLFLAGLGFGGVAPVATSLLSELAPPEHRGRLIAWTQVLWVLGWCAAALGGGWFERQLGWRGIVSLGALPVGIGLLGWRHIPESPRFLLARGRQAEAEALALQLASQHGVHVPIGEPQRRSAPASAAGQLAELWSPRWRRRTFTLWTTWIGINAILVGPIAWLPVLLAERGSALALQTSALVGFAMLPGTLMAVALIDRAGRRPLLLGSLGVAVLGSLPLMAARDELWIGCGAAAVAGGVLAAWPVVLAWASEQYPTRIRASAVGWASGCARLGAIGAPAATGLLLGRGGDDRAAAVWPFAVLLLAAFASVALFGEETAGRPLEDLST